MNENLRRTKPEDVMKTINTNKLSHTLRESYLSKFPADKKYRDIIFTDENIYEHIFDLVKCRLSTLKMKSARAKHNNTYPSQMLLNSYEEYVIENFEDKIKYDIFYYTHKNRTQFSKPVRSYEEADRTFKENKQLFAQIIDKYKIILNSELPDPRLRYMIISQFIESEIYSCIMYYDEIPTESIKLHLLNEIKSTYAILSKDTTPCTANEYEYKPDNTPERDCAIQFITDNSDKLNPIIAEAKRIIKDLESDADLTDTVLCQRNIEENIIRMIIRSAVYENIIEYISHNLIRTLYNDIKHLVAKHRPIIPLSTKDCYTMIRFDMPRMSENEASRLFDEHYDEIKPIIDEITEIAKTDIPDCEEKDIVIPYAIHECAVYAIIYSSPEQTPVQAVKENLLNELKKEIQYLMKT